MITIKTATIGQAWREAMKELYINGKPVERDELFRDESLVIEVGDVTRDLFDDRFGMSKEDTDRASHYLVTGEDEARVTHEWTKIYRKRLFEGNFNQIEAIINYLKHKPHGKRAQASIWQQSLDLHGPIAPCLQLLWLQVADGQLDIHVHMRASDCYGKLLMNMNEFAALQRHVAQKLSVPPGRYIHFIDTCHFNTSDRKKIEDLIEIL